MSSPSETSDDPEAFNPFEMLSDYEILHIFSFLPGADLLKLSGMDKNFNRIITKTSETMSKIRLVLNFRRRLDLDFIIKLAQTRRFTALKLMNFTQLTDANATVKLFSLFESQSGSVDDLAIHDDRYGFVVPRELLASVIATFLPKLKKFQLYIREPSDYEGASNIAASSGQSNVNHPLESLEIECPEVGNFLQLFTGCNQLKTFRCGWSDIRGIEHFNNFLSAQEHLELLYTTRIELPWTRLKCFQLKELTAYHIDADGELAAAEFLKKLPKLTKLETSVKHSRPLLEAICRLPKLEKLTTASWKCDDDTLERLENRTVKKLRIYCSDYTASLLKIFLGVESVDLSVNGNVFDLSDVPAQTIKKIELNEDQFEVQSTFVVKISPSEIPASVEQFESALLKFAEECSKFVFGIEIGHASWRNSGDFRLSNSFCEGLVNILPYLMKLEVYNIDDQGRFTKFLHENENRLNLEDVKLHEPFKVGEPKLKKMKIWSQCN